MANTKTKRSIPKKQSTPSDQLSLKTKKPAPISRRFNDRRFVQFPQVKGKRVEAVELLTAPDYHSISINFKDKTCLHFSVQTGFTVQPEYSDWRTGEQRIIRKWPLMKSRTLR
jgi:hypothetical protein